MKYRFTFALIALILTPTLLSAHERYELKFRQGDLRTVKIQEVLRLFMVFPGVDSTLAEPSIRTTNYSFTERVDSVYSDGSALIAATLDSFKTVIDIGEGRDRSQFFSFNSSSEYDLTHELHDIKVLPRGQFLGQTLRFTMYPDGTVHSFRNLQAFHELSVGKGYDYDFVHAMVSLTDSLRMGQLLEQGFGGIGAVEEPYHSRSTVTEIPVDRVVTAHEVKPGTITLQTIYSNPPSHIEYLEGLATPLGIQKFWGGGSGEATLKDGYLLTSHFSDTATLALTIDVDHMPERITRHVTVSTFPIRVLHGGTISIKQGATHEQPVSGPDTKQTSTPEN